MRKYAFTIHPLRFTSSHNYVSNYVLSFSLFSFFSVEGEPHEKAVELLKAARNSVKLVVRYTPKVLEEMEMRFDKQRQARRKHMYS